MAPKITAEQTVKEVIERYPQTQAVFASYDLDLCCGGAHPIGTAAESKGVELRKLLADLNAAIGA